MSYKPLKDFISVLDQAGELIRVKEFVNPELEITEVVDRFSKVEGGGKALLFENNGTDFPLLINAFGSLKRMQMALGVDDLDDVGERIDEFIKTLSSPRGSFFGKIKMLPELSKVSSWMPKNKKGSAPCQENIILNPNVNDLPVLKCWPADGGKFFTLPMVITKDPHTNIRNVGMYRMQIFEDNLTGMHWHRHKVGARHFEEYKKLGQKMPVAVALGGDPVLTYSATAPLPDNIDEYLFAGFLRQKPVEMVKCKTNSLEVPAEADIIIEGYVDPEEGFIYEGPFGDHTGFYSLPDYYPKFHVTCITHKNDAVYPATIVGIPPMEDAWIAKATERIFLTPIKYALAPEVEDLDLPFSGVGHNITIVKIDKKYPGQGLKVMNALWGAGQMMFNKILIVFDKGVNIHNYLELAQEIFRNTRIGRDIYFSKGPLDVLDHASDSFAFGGKLGIDATTKLPEEGIEVNHQEIKSTTNVKLDKSLFKDSGLEGINLLQTKYKLPILVISINKERVDSISDLVTKIVNKSGISTIKTTIVVDKEVPVDDFEMISWIVSGNLDINRDCRIITLDNGNAFLLMDGTMKILDKDKFARPWPNVIISEDTTIDKVDQIWEDIGLGEMIQSPSLRYKHFVKNKGAFSREK